MDIKIMLAYEGDPLAVRRKLRVSARVWRRGKLHRRSRIQAVVPELSLRIEEQVFGIGRPRVGGDVIPRHPLDLALVMHLANRRSKLRQFDLTDQYLLLARHRVPIPEFTVLASVVALDERDPGAVRTPLDRLRSASRNAALREDLFDRELFRRDGLSEPRGKQP